MSPGEAAGMAVWRGRDTAAVFGGSRGGVFLRQLQRCEHLEMPHSRPMPTIGRRCHELRVNDVGGTWRLIYRIDADAIVILDVFAKKTPKTPEWVIRNCQRRLKEYDDA
jgi:phage-related protein